MPNIYVEGQLAEKLLSRHKQTDTHTGKVAPPDPLKCSVTKKPWQNIVTWKKLSDCERQGIFFLSKVETENMANRCRVLRASVL